MGCGILQGSVSFWGLDGSCRRERRDAEMMKNSHQEKKKKSDT